MMRYLEVWFLGLVLLGTAAWTTTPEPTRLPGVFDAAAFGAVPNDSLPDGQALQAAVDSLRAWALRWNPPYQAVDRANRFAVLTLRLRPGLYLLERPLVVDLSVVHLEGAGAVLRATSPFRRNDCLPPALFVAYSSLKWQHGHGENLRGRERGRVQDLTLVRPTHRDPSLPRIGLWIGAPPHACPQVPAGPRNAFFVFSGVTVFGFPVAVDFGNHTWRITFEHSKFTGCDTTFLADPARIAPEGGLEFGENMRVVHSVLASGVSVFRTGEFHLLGVSLLNHSLLVGGDATVFVSHSHLENPGGRPPLGRFAVVQGPHGFLSLRDSRVIPGRPPDGPLDRALFYVDSTSGGLVLNGLHFSRNDAYQPELRDTNRVLVAGPGPVVARDIRTYSAWGSMVVLARSLNLLTNGGAEQGLEGWQVQGPVEVLRKGARAGQACFALASGSQMVQQVALRPGDLVWVHLWGRAEGTAGAVLTLQFLGASGTVRMQKSWRLPRGTAWQVWVPPVVRAPAGTTFLRVSVEASGSGRYLLDELLINRS